MTHTHSGTHTHSLTHSGTHTHTHTHSLTPRTCSKKFGSSFYNGKITQRNVFGLATDSKPRYQVVYEDGDAEELYVEEIIPLLQNPLKKQNLENAVSDLEKLMMEKKKAPEDRNEFLFSFDKRHEEFFGSTVKERRQVCSSIHNYCIFSHNVESCRCDHGVSPWQKATACSPCAFHHEAECCKCDRVAMTVGQDESVFHAYILGTYAAITRHYHHLHRLEPPCAHTHTYAQHTPRSTHIGNKTWYVQNKVGLRKKSNGPGCHVSAFTGYTLGFGLKVPLQQSVMEECNERRKREKSAVDGTPKVSLKTNPAVRTIMIGVNRDGWWDEVQLMKQSEDVLDFLETWDTEDRYQFVGHFDQSVAHNKKNTHALVSARPCLLASCAFVHAPPTRHSFTPHSIIGSDKCRFELGGQANCSPPEHCAARCSW